jgi:methionyl-tRNA synthetase
MRRKLLIGVSVGQNRRSFNFFQDSVNNFIKTLFSWCKLRIMQFKRLHSFRIFIVLLVSVFFIDTVYASGMMAVDQLHDNNNSPVELHNHDDHEMAKHNHDSGQKQSSNDQCSKCGHCLACFTVLPPAQSVEIQFQLQATTLSLFEPSYLSHISAQPQRPPIS